MINCASGSQQNLQNFHLANRELLGSEIISDLQHLKAFYPPDVNPIISAVAYDETTPFTISQIADEPLTTPFVHNESQPFWSSEVWQEKTLWWRIILVSILVIFGSIGNLTIIVSMCKLRQFRSKPTNIFILNMAIGDLITVIFCPIVALINVVNQFYELGPVLCKLEGPIKGKLFTSNKWNLT